MRALPRVRVTDRMVEAAIATYWDRDAPTGTKKRMRRAIRTALRVWRKRRKR